MIHTAILQVGEKKVPQPADKLEVSRPNAVFDLVRIVGD